MIKAERATTIVILILAACFILLAQGFSPSARIVPLIMSAATFLVAAVQLLSEWIPSLKPLVGEVSEEEGKLLEEPRYLKRTAVVCSSIVLLLALIYLVGLSVALPIYTGLFLYVISKRKPLLIVILTAVMALFSYVLIIQLLGVPWDEGWLWTLLV